MWLGGLKGGCISCDIGLDFDMSMISTRIKTHLPFRNYSTSSEVLLNHNRYFILSILVADLI